MPTEIKPSKFLANSQHIFFDTHKELAEQVHEFIDLQKWERLANILGGLSENEKELLHYAFYDIYGFDYELKIRSIVGSYSKLRKLGLA